MSAPEDQWRRPRPATRRSKRSPVLVALRAGLLSLAAGPLVGVVWWVTSLRDRGSSYLDLVQSVGAADAGFALVSLLAGAAAGVWWVLAREDTHEVRGVARLVGLLLGGLLGACVAWLVGTGIALAVPLDMPDLPAGTVTELSRPRTSLAVLAGVLLWPLGVGVLVAVDTLRELVWQALSSDERLS